MEGRTEVFGALGLLKTYFLQKNFKLEELKRNENKVLEGSFIHNNKEIKINVPYSPSPRLIKNGITTMDELVKMYRRCFTS